MDFAAQDSGNDLFQRLHIHCFGQGVTQDFVDQRVIGYTRLGIEIFGARSRIGKDRSQQVIGAHTLNLRRNFLAAVKARKDECARRIPAPASGEDGGS